MLSVGAGLLLLWGVLLLLLWRARPPDLTVREALRLLPDLVRLVRRLASTVRCCWLRGTPGEMAAALDAMTGEGDQRWAS